MLKYLKLIRFDKLIGTLLLLWPTLWGIWVASHGRPDILILTTFLAGVFLMRSAGCVINDLCDRNFDGHVSRTRNRPLVTNVPTERVEVKPAIYLMLGLLTVAFLLLLNLNNWKLIGHAIIALALACVYPCCKRFFACPQFVLGLAFGYGIPMAFIAITGQTNAITWLLYSASIILTIIYDNFYAMADLPDDMVLGLRSSVIWFGKYNIAITVFLQICLLINFIILSYLLEFKAYYFIIFLLLLLFVYQLKLVNSDLPHNYIRAFKNNNWVGFLVFLGFVIEYI